MDQIVYHDRYSKKDRVEQVYGDRALRWTYNTFAGKLALAAAVKRAWFSRWYGWRMDSTKSKSKIQPFIDEFGLDVGEFAKQPHEFASFNDFFSRALQPQARPIDTAPTSVVFPADGRHLCVPRLSDYSGLFVKGEMLDLAALLSDDALLNAFANGSLLLSRLCPTDYHRFHFPVAGEPGKTSLINGPLYSVNPIALKQNIQILATNKRTLTVLESARFGKVLLIEVGATCVGSIRQTFQPNTPADKGEQKGYFRFGGSSTITIFQAGRIQFADDLIEQSLQHRELYARMGDVAAALSN